MARVYCSFDTGAVSLAANTAKTLIGLTAGTNQVVAWTRVVVTFEGVTAGDKPSLIEWGLYASGGTSAGATEQIITNPGTLVTPQAAALTYSSEPTITVKGSIYCHMQSGYERVYQRGQDEITYANSTWCLRVTNPTGNQTTNVRATLEWEE